MPSKAARTRVRQERGQADASIARSAPPGHGRSTPQGPDPEPPTRRRGCQSRSVVRRRPEIGSSPVSRRGQDDPFPARYAPSMSETWALLLPATFGLLGTLAGGYLIYRRNWRDEEASRQPIRGKDCHLSKQVYGQAVGLQVRAPGRTRIPLGIDRARRRPAARPSPDATNYLRRRVQHVGPAGDHPITPRRVAPLDADRTRAFGVAGDQEARFPQFTLDG